MIIGIGVDLVHTPRMSRLIQTYRKPLISKFLRPDEMTARTLYPQRIAGIVAAKEAVIKATSSLVKKPLSFHDILILHTEGAPHVRLPHHAQLKCYSILVAISHQGEYSVATAICSH